MASGHANGVFGRAAPGGERFVFGVGAMRSRSTRSFHRNVDSRARAIDDERRRVFTTFRGVTPARRSCRCGPGSRRFPGDAATPAPRFRS